VAGALLSRRFQKMRSSFRGRQRFGDLHRHFAWQAQHFRRVALRVFANRIVKAARSCANMQQQMANMHQQQQNMGNGGLANLHIFRQATPQRRAFTNGTENPATESTLQQNATVEKNDQKAETTTTVDKSQPETTTADKSKADTTLAPAETSILRLQILRFKGKFVGKHRF